MTFSALSLAIILFFAGTVVVCIYRGRERGFFKSLIFLGCSFLSMLTSIIISPLLSQLFIEPISQIVLPQITKYQELISQYASMDALIKVFVTAILSSIIFVLLFFILQLLSYSICILIGTISKNGFNDHSCTSQTSYCAQNSKKLGAVIGFVCAILFTMVLTSPIMGILDVTSATLTATEFIMPNASEDAFFDKNDADAIKKHSKDVVGNVFYRFGGQTIFRSAASARYNGNSIYLAHEIDVVLKASSDFSIIAKFIEQPELCDADDINTIYSLRDNICDLELCHIALAEFISQEFTHWKNGSDNILKKPNFPEVLEYAFDCVIDICINSTPDNIRENISTVLNIISIILDSGINKHSSSDLIEIISCISNSNMIERINFELANNESFSGISFTSVAMSIVVKQIDISITDPQKHDELLKNIATAISTVTTRGYGTLDEKLSVLSSTAKDYFSDFGLDISDEMAQYAADVLLNHFDLDQSEISPEDIEEFFNSFKAQ